MKMKPILFNTDMVRGLLNGTKTATRRMVKEPYYIDDEEASRVSGLAIHRGTNMTDGMPYPDQPYRPGDILYVRETWYYETFCEDTANPPDLPSGNRSWRYVYKADNPDYPVIPGHWHPSIHMPREAARIFLRVTDVRVERLQSITELDILEKEGVIVDFPQPKPSYMSLAYTETRLKPAVRKAFADLWDRTIKPKDRTLYGWDANPWIWVIEFERCEKPGGD